MNLACGFETTHQDLWLTGRAPRGWRSHGRPFVRPHAAHCPACCMRVPSCCALSRGLEQRTAPRGGGTIRHLIVPPPHGAPPRPARARAAPRSSPLFAPRPLGTWVSRQTARQVVNSNGRRAVTPASCRGAACLMGGFPMEGRLRANMLWDSIVRYKTERGALGSKTGYRVSY